MLAEQRRILDLTRDLGAVSRLGPAAEVVDGLLAESLDTLGRVIPFDLAAILELDGDSLRVRVARGPLEVPAVRQHRLQLRDYPSLRAVLADGHARAFLEADHSHGDGDPYDGVLDLDHGHACMVVPLRAGADTLGVMTLDRATCGVYGAESVRLAEVFGRLLALAIVYGEQSLALTRLRDQLEEQNRLLRERVEPERDAGALLDACPSPVMAHVVRLARQVAPTDAPVLVTGETGVGKEVLARAIHGWSHRADRPLVTINCAALPAGLIESELFGHVRGAFTGATGSRIGRFRAANGGTLFLDEVGEIPPDVQAKLLRVLQEGCFEPVGSDRTVRVDVRVIAATNVDLQAATRDRRFREDLYYRLAVFPLRVPPLRARLDDVPVIVSTVLASISRRTGRGPWTVAEADLRALQVRPWHGNVRELVNALERATILSAGRQLELASRPDPPTQAEPERRIDDPGPRLVAWVELEREHVRAVLTHTHGRVHGEGGAAAILGLKPSTLQSRMRKLGLGGARAFRKALSEGAPRSEGGEPV